MRLAMPPGPIAISANLLMEVDDTTDPDIRGLREHAVEDLPDDTLIYLLGSLYVERSKMTQMA